MFRIVLALVQDKIECRLAISCGLTNDSSKFLCMQFYLDRDSITSRSSPLSINLAIRNTNEIDDELIKSNNEYFILCKHHLTPTSYIISSPTSTLKTMTNTIPEESAKMEEGIIDEAIPSTESGKKRLSTVSKMYDLNGDGKLDEAELASK